MAGWQRSPREVHDLRSAREGSKEWILRHSRGRHSRGQGARTRSERARARQDRRLLLCGEGTLTLGACGRRGVEGHAQGRGRARKGRGRGRGWGRGRGRSGRSIEREDGRTGGRGDGGTGGRGDETRDLAWKGGPTAGGASVARAPRLLAAGGYWWLAMARASADLAVRQTADGKANFQSVGTHARAHTAYAAQGRKLAGAS
jgi:hypothetical protein